MKKISFLLILLSIFSFSLMAQELESDSDNFEESDEMAENDEFTDFDDFDSIFDDAEDVEEAVVEEKTSASNTQKVVSSAFSSMVHFSGTFTGDVGLAYVKNDADNVNDEKDKPSGYFTLKNSLNMLVKPSNIFVIHGTLDTGIDYGFNLSLSSLYFDYILFDHLYITAGKKSISWGNLRLFNNSTYYGCGVHSGGLYSTGPRYVDIFAEDGAQLSLELRYPWTFGTITFATTTNQTSSLEIDTMNYYGSIEVSVFNTNINLFAKRPEKASSKDPVTNEVDPEKRKMNLVGLELKRTIFGFDTYMQTIARIKGFNNLTHSEGYQYIIATAGLYRLWDAFDPNVGFNIEYQHEFNTTTPEEHYDRLAFEGGIKRLGKKKNIKFGVMSHYNITEKYGFSGLTFIISGICPYADWSNKFAVGYGDKYENPVFMLSSAISLSLDY